MKKFLTALIFAAITSTASFAAKYETIPARVKMPSKYTQDYVNEISATYKKVSDSQIFFVVYQ